MTGYSSKKEDPSPSPATEEGVDKMDVSELREGIKQAWGELEEVWITGDERDTREWMVCAAELWERIDDLVDRASTDSARAEHFRLVAEAGEQELQRLTDALTEAKQDSELTDAACVLADYAFHHDDCPASYAARSWEAHCSCGWREAEAAYQAALTATAARSPSLPDPNKT